MGIYIQSCTWDEVPHLSEEVKKDLWESTPPYLRNARAKGIPVLGSGLIYPIAEEEIKVSATLIRITKDWPRGFAMDVSFNKTAVSWFARDPASKVIYLHDCHYQGREEPAIHAEAIKARGAWIPGVIDPRADNRSAEDSKKLFQMYTQQYGLDLVRAEAAVTTGISEVWQMLQGGMLKVSDAACMAPFWKEIRIYRTKTDKDGNISVVKQDDHLMDNLRYFVMSGIRRMRTEAEGSEPQSSLIELLLGASRGRGRSGSLGWMSG